MCVCTHSKNLIFASYKLEKVHLIGLAASLSSTRQTSAGRLLLSCFTAAAFRCGSLAKTHH
jgi:hypothetical protein